jgi:hypothetical protein
MTQSRQMLIGKPTDSTRRLGSSIPPRTGSKKRARTLPLIYESVLIDVYALQRPRGQGNELRSLRTGTPTISSTKYRETGQRWLLHGRVGPGLKAGRFRERPTTSGDSARESA